MRGPKYPVALAPVRYPLDMRKVCRVVTSVPLIPNDSVRVSLMLPVPLETGFEETVVSNGMVVGVPRSAALVLDPTSPYPLVVLLPEQIWRVAHW